MIEFHGQVKNGCLTFPPPQDALRGRWLSESEGKFVTERMFVKRPLRTQQQIKCHYGLLINSVIAKANNEGIDTSTFLKMMVQEDIPTGIGLTKDFLHEVFLIFCPTYRDGVRITLSKMTIDEASQWFDQCRNLLASRGIYITDPDPNWKSQAAAKGPSGQKGEPPA